MPLHPRRHDGGNLRGDLGDRPGGIDKGEAIRFRMGQGKIAGPYCLMEAL
jgi:hypothetical protein